LYQILTPPPLSRNGQPKPQWGLDDLAFRVLGFPVKVPIGRHPRWSWPHWQFNAKQIHYAANDAIAVSYIYDRSKASAANPAYRRPKESKR